MKNNLWIGLIKNRKTQLDFWKDIGIGKVDAGKPQIL